MADSAEIKSLRGYEKTVFCRSNKLDFCYYYYVSKIKNKVHNCYNDLGEHCIETALCKRKYYETIK